MTLVVKKFGGTSVGSPERIRAVAERVARARARGERVALVVSAMGDTTDELLALASAVAPGAAATRRREMDQLLATGEQAAIALVALALEECGVPAVSFTGPQAEIWTDGAHGAARITEVRASRVRRALEEGRVPVVAGFQGLSAAEELTTLGRGGSDTTAVALAIALGAARCDIYTDVDGIYSADPRRVPTARRWDRLAHREALLLALAGAAVLHPRAAALAESYRMPLRILSSLTNGPECGTCIDGEASVEGPRILGVAAAVGSARLTVDDPPGGAAAVLAALAEAGVGVEWLEEKRADDGARRLTAIVPADRADDAQRAAASVLGDGARIAVERPVARITVVGTGLSACGAAIARALQRLARRGIEPEGLGISELGLTLYVRPDQADPAAALLHEALLPAQPLNERRPA